MKSGPDISYLCNRLASCPREFQANPVVHAVVADLIQDLGGGLPRLADLAFFMSTPGDDEHRANHLRVVLVACWLLHDEWFCDWFADPQEGRGISARLLRGLEHGLADVAKIVDAGLFITDADRREELARICLDGLGMIPQGETKAQAEDRLAMLDSVEHERVIRETQAQRERVRIEAERAEELRRKLAAERAREAAGRYQGE